jgi:hypothetical protein
MSLLRTTAGRFAACVALAVPGAPAAGEELKLVATATVLGTDSLVGPGGSPLTPEFLDERPIIGQQATVWLRYAGGGFGEDMKPAHSADGEYPYEGASEFVIRFGSSGRFDGELVTVSIRHASLGSEVEYWRAASSVESYRTQHWEAKIHFLENEHNLFSDDSMKPYFDVEAFVADSSPDTVWLEELVSGAYLRLEIDWAGFAPRIFTQPEPAIANEGGAPFSLAVDAEEAQSFKWYRDGQVIDDGPLYGGARTESLTIKPHIDAIGEYRCSVANGNGAIETDRAIVAIRPDINPDPCLPDLNGDGILDLADIVAFVTAFTDGCP